MFNGNQVIDADGHVMEPNGLYDAYLDPKFRPDLEDLKREVAARPSKFFFRFLPSAQHRPAARRTESR